MSETLTPADIQPLADRVVEAHRQGKLSVGAVENIHRWLTEPRYSAYLPSLARHIQEQKWRELDDAFWTVIPFGTGGRRGRMYEIGSNAINERTIGESAQGLANYVRELKPAGPWSCAIAFDTRHRSRQFAELCAEIMVASDFRVFMLDHYRSTPALSFLVRFKQCDCGIMVTASHNPPSDNAVKVYGSNGGQLVPPHDANVIRHVENVQEIHRADFQSAVQEGRISICTEEADQALLDAHLRHSFPGPRDLKILFSPLHGVGEHVVCRLLDAAGFKQVEVFPPHRQPDGDFPNVPGHVANPENPEVFDSMIEYAQQRGHELILATDPDGDRLGAAVGRKAGPSGDWTTLSGNQLAALLADFVLEQRKPELTADHYVLTTLVTTGLVRRIAEDYGVKCIDQLLVGFKWIGDMMDRLGPQHFVYATEESHGYLVGDHVRDKDGAVACLLMSQLAAAVKARGHTVLDRLGDLYRRHGYHAERLVTIHLPGSDGMRRMVALMQHLRESPPERLGSLPVSRVRDYAQGTVRTSSGQQPLEGPTGDLLIFDLDELGNRVAVRPSGTEPKIKMYLFGVATPEQSQDLRRINETIENQLREIERDVRAIAGSIT